MDRNQHGYSEGEMRLFGFNMIWERRREWSWKTFGPPEVRGPVGALKHLVKEAAEALDTPGNIIEYADCLLLILDAADRAGFTELELLNATLDKLAVNEKRAWPDWRGADPAIPIEHDRSSDENA